MTKILYVSLLFLFKESDLFFPTFSLSLETVGALHTATYMVQKCNVFILGA